MGYTHITGRHIGGDTDITSDMCMGIQISRGYTYHCDSGFIEAKRALKERRSRDRPGEEKCEKPPARMGCFFGKSVR